MHPLLLLVIYCLIIVAGSLLGGWLPSLLRLTHRRMQYMISLVAGLMLGVAILHLLPHSMIYTRSIDQSVMWMLGGLLGMFFLVRAFHFHQHGPVEPPIGVAASHADHHHDHGGGHHHHDHDHDHDHGGHVHGHAHELPNPAKHRLGWVGVALGLSLHTAIDGIALAASVRAESLSDSALPLFGLSTFLVIFLHKPLDALSITTLMAAGGWSFRARQFVNLGFSLMCPLGALLFYLGVGADQNEVIGCALALAAGAFLCIALGDLLPEVQFHSHDRLGLSLSLILGIAAAYGIGKLEHGMHNHDLPSPSGQHDHSGHDHSGHSH